METRSSKTAPRGSTWWAALALVAIAAFFVRDALFAGKVLLPFDALEQFEPWRSAVAEYTPPKNPLLLDQVIVIAPWMKFASERLHAGELPLWNSLNYAGEPIGGAYQVGLYWPLNWIYFAAPSWSFFGWSAFAKLALSGVCMLGFLRALRLRTGAAAIGAVSFMLCGFNVAWLGHNQTNVALFAPLLLWLVERIAERPSARRFAVFALAIALQFTAGHAQTSAHLCLVVAAYVVFRSRVEVNGTKLDARALTRLALATALGALVAAPQLWPFFEYLRDSQGLASNARTDLVTRQDAWKGLALLVAPHLFGSPLSRDYSGPSGDHLNYNELIGSHVGLLALALALLGLAAARAKWRWFFGALLAVALCAAFQLAPIYDMLHALPLLGATKWMRFSLFAALALAVLAALGVQALCERFDRSARFVRVMVVALFSITALELYAFGADYNPAVEPSLAAPRTRVTDFLIEKLHSEPPFRVLAADGRSLIANANLFYDLPLLTGYDSIELARSSALIRALSSDPRGAVFAQEIRWFDKNLPLGSLLGVRYLLSSTALPEPFRLVLDAECKVYENPAALPAVFFANDTAVLPDSSQALEFVSSPTFDPRVAVLERDPPTEFPRYVPELDDELIDGNRLTLKAYNVRSLAFEATVKERKLIVIPAAFAPGWRATANGIEIPIERVDYGLRGVWLDWGRWKVELRYEPASTHIGLWISAAALVMLVVLCARRGTRS